MTAEEEAMQDAMRRHLLAAVDAVARHPDGQRVLGEALCAGLDTVGAGAPRYEAFGNMRESAAWWADTATPVEIELYLAAALRRVSRVDFADRARKRVFWAMWEAMPEEQRAAFLSRVERDAAPP